MDVELDLDDVAERHGRDPGREGEVDPELLAAQLAGRFEPCMARAAGELLDASELEIEALRSGDVADRQLAVDDPAVAALAGFRVAAAFRETSTRETLAPSAGRLVQTSSGGVFIQEKGPPDGIPVVLFHGTAAWSELWWRTSDALAAANFRVIALDLPGHGRSARPDAPPWPARMFVRRISRLDPVPRARSRATHLAGSKYCTCESCRPVVTSRWGYGTRATLS